MDANRLDETGGASVHTHDGKVLMTLWLAGRKPTDDPFRIEMTPGETLGLVGDLAKAAKDALLRHLGARR